MSNKNQQKRSKLSAILNFKCPDCHEGDLFETGTWSYNKPFDMPQECPNCKLNFFPEPGFYWGAMFISYIFWGWVCVIIGGIGIILFGLSVNQATLVLLLFSATFFIWLFRISRSIWLHIASRKPKSKKKSVS
jgi:hypothetical protein